MTPPPGNVRPDGHGGLRVVIEGVEHWISPVDAAYLFSKGNFAFLYDPDPAPVLRCEPRRRTGHILPSRDDTETTEHLIIAIYPDHRYLALTDEVREVQRGERDICKVLMFPPLKGEEAHAAD